ncbi:MAG: cytochrome c-type biogenesis protein CcmH [Acidimicrobiia bacterium]
MRRLLAWSGVAAVAAAALALGLRPTGDAASPAARTQRIASGLRCPVCQGLSVKDSDSPTARDIRADIRRRVDAGEAPSAIRQAYVDRYGEWILLRPRRSGFDALVWVVPAAALAAGAVTLGGLFWRWRRRTAADRPPTEEERGLVAAALDGRRP